MTDELAVNATYDPDVETRAVELTCRHLALLPCEVCGCDRTIVRVEEN